MKRIWGLMAAFLLLTACGAVPPETPVETAAVISPAVEQPELPQKEEILRFEVMRETYEDSAETEDGTLLAAYRFELPFLQVIREDGSVVGTAETSKEEAALAVAGAFNEHFGKWAAAEEFDGLVLSAEEHLGFMREEGAEWFGGYALELVTSVYQTEYLASVAGSYYSYTGGAHPNTWQLGWNFDLETGTFFAPEDLAADGAAFQEAIHQELISQAEAVAAEYDTAPEQFFWEDYREILANWSSYAVFFDAEGMTVVFSPYELACYAAGTQVFFVTYDWLRPHLSEHGCTVLGLE